MNKTITTTLFLLLLANFIFGQTNISKGQFLSMVVQIEQLPEENKLKAEIISSRIVNAKLKRPTISATSNSEKNLVVQFLTKKNEICNSIVIENPFFTDYEYVNEEDELERVRLPETKKAFHIRIPYQESMAFVQIGQYTKSGKQIILKSPLN